MALPRRTGMNWNAQPGPGGPNSFPRPKTTNSEEKSLHLRSDTAVTHIQTWVEAGERLREL